MTLPLIRESHINYIECPDNPLASDGRKSSTQTYVGSVIGPRYSAFGIRDHLRDERVIYEHRGLNIIQTELCQSSTQLIIICMARSRDVEEVEQQKQPRDDPAAEMGNKIQLRV